MKICNTCKEIKELSEFSKDKTHKDGYKSQCKSCSKEYYKANVDKIRKWQKEYRKTNVEKKKEYNKKYYNVNADKLIEQKREYYKINVEKIKEQKRKYHSSPAGKETEQRYLLKLRFSNSKISRRTLTIWSRQIKQKDNHSCQYCGSSNKLHAHHILSKSKHPELALNLNNGITLCFNCHMEEHRINGEI